MNSVIESHSEVAAPGPEGADSAHGGLPASEVRSLDRAVAILNAFTRKRNELGVSEIAQLTGLNTSTTHRLLGSLAAHGLVQQASGSRRYALGSHVLRLAYIASGHVNVQEAALPVMRRLRDASDETVGLHLLRADNRRIVVDQVESHKPLRRTYTELGEPIPLHQGAPGKVFLAFLSAEAREAILAGPLEAATDVTPTDVSKLSEELTLIRERGYSLSFGERVADIHTVAVPVANHTGAVIASLSITGPTARMPRERLEALAELGMAAGRELSRYLGYVAPNQATGQATGEASGTAPGGAPGDAP
ncbi:MAG: IclR family transcriptional regulator [Trueperaceae bacterium]